MKFANCSIDISDGLISDLEKMINRQDLCYTLYENCIPISNQLKKLINEKKLIKEEYISKGDDYQVLFTASASKARIILNTSKKLGIKIAKIGKINSRSKQSLILDQKGKQILIKNKGYIHEF